MIAFISRQYIASDMNWEYLQAYCEWFEQWPYCEAKETSRDLACLYDAL